MSKEPKDFEITKLLELTDREKYAATVAAFEIIEKLEQLDIPKKYQSRKPSIRALVALSEKIVQFDFIDDETRNRIDDELKETRKSRSALDDVFSSAPVSDDSDEDLEEIVDMESAEDFVEPAGLDDESEDGETPLRDSAPGISKKSEDDEESDDEDDDSDDDSDDDDEDDDSDDDEEEDIAEEE